MENVITLLKSTSGVRCPGVVFGWGATKNAAIKLARTYASTFGDSVCGRYIGHCESRKYGK